MEKVLRNLPTIDLPKSSLASSRDTTIFVAFIPQNNNYVIFDRYFQRAKDYKIT